MCAATAVDQSCGYLIAQSPAVACFAMTIAVRGFTMKGEETSKTLPFKGKDGKSSRDSA